MWNMGIWRWERWADPHNTTGPRYDRSKARSKQPEFLNMRKNPITAIALILNALAEGNTTHATASMYSWWWYGVAQEQHEYSGRNRRFPISSYMQQLSSRWRKTRNHFCQHRSPNLLLSTLRYAVLAHTLERDSGPKHFVVPVRVSPLFR